MDSKKLIDQEPTGQDIWRDTWQSLKNIEGLESKPKLSTQEIQEIERFANLDLNSTLQDYFQRLSKWPISLNSYFADLRSKLLIVVDESSQQVRLSFGDSPSGKNFNPIKALLSHDVCTRLQPFSKTEFTIGFGQLCELKEVAWAIALEYRALGYSCCIRCEGEAISVDQILAEAEPSPLWRQLEEVPLCA